MQGHACFVFQPKSRAHWVLRISGEAYSSCMQVTAGLSRQTQRSDWPISGGVTQLKDSGSFSSPQRGKKGLLRAVVANHHHRR
ncbi:hypothetical protein INR49_011785 [Caranx melampygus]|nr:hypothetical protein INR49_011785 [Caranx melampygus]